MYRIAIHIRWGPPPRAGSLFLCLAVLLLVTASARPLQSAEAAGPEAPAAYVGKGAGPHFYLTNFSRTGSTPKTACAPGYHMASLWEIYDVSNLAYDYNHPNATTKGDSGRSAPSHWYGWVRTGWDSSTVNIAGQANCAVWTSTSGTAYGTIARLNYNWDVSVGAVGPWEANTWPCDGTAPVWCVAYVQSTYLPYLRR